MDAAGGCRHVKALRVYLLAKLQAYPASFICLGGTALEMMRQLALCSRDTSSNPAGLHVTRLEGLQTLSTARLHPGVPLDFTPKRTFERQALPALFRTLADWKVAPSLTARAGLPGSCHALTSDQLPPYLLKFSTACSPTSFQPALTPPQQLTYIGRRAQ